MGEHYWKEMFDGVSDSKTRIFPEKFILYETETERLAILRPENNLLITAMRRYLMDPKNGRSL